MAAPLRLVFMVDRAVAAVRLIGENVRQIRNSPQMPFNMLSSLILNIKASNSIDLLPLLQVGTPAQVDNIVTRFILGWTNPNTSLTAVSNSLTPLMDQFQILKNAIGDPVTWSPSQGEIWVTVTSPQLATLHPALDGILTALAPLE